jgi:TIR domain
MNDAMASQIRDHRPTLAVHVVWHPQCAVGLEYGKALFAHLFEDPDDLTAHGLRIPVRLWRSEPVVPPIAEADHSVLVVLIDEELIKGGAPWRDFLEEAAGAIREDSDDLLPVSLTPAANELNAPSLLRYNMVRLHDVDDTSLRPVVLVNRIAHALYRRITGRGVSVFLSHAKQDGLPIARRVGDYLRDGTGIKDFFDAQDLPEGSRWEELIKGAAADHVLLAIRTDAYATREWCRTEVLAAKRASSPVVVLDALTDFEPRGFPYLGNAPAVRWSDDFPDAARERLLRVILQESLRFRYFRLRVADLCRAYGLDMPYVLPAPPELLTALRAREAAPSGRWIYPDPPLGTEELEIVCELAPGPEPLTPNELIAGR